MRIILIVTFFLLILESSFSQESIGEHTVEYIININGLKTKAQEKNIKKNISKLDNVKYCNINFIEYKLNITIFEKGNSSKNLFTDELKRILLNNGVEINKIERKVKKWDILYCQ